MRSDPRSLASTLGLSPVQARAAQGALRAVVEADGPPRAAGVRLLATAARALELGEVPVATPRAVLEVVTTPAMRRGLVDALLIAACIEGEVTPAGEAVVRSFARALGVRSPWVDVLGPLRRRRAFAVKRRLAVRSPDARRLFARIWAEEGLAGLWRAVRFVLGRYTDPATAARFRLLGALPPGTYGRMFFDHLVSRGLAFPGEPGGMPERMIHHDLMHVANGYGTDPAGECELAGFYAACCPDDGFTFIVTALATFHLGLAVSPAAVTPARGAFDPQRVLEGYLRGRRLRVDIMGPWDYWSLLPLPIAEARARLGIAAATG